MNLGKFAGAALMAMLFSAQVCAQGNWQDVVYLKNGSVIRGMIVEQVPNKSLTVKTPDGSVFICDMVDVVKITKEENPKGRSACSSRTEKAVNGYTGYKGFADMGLTGGDYGSLEWSTTHGCQIIPARLFVGAGIGIQYFGDWDYSDNFATYGIPLYVDVRSNLLTSKISPFFDFKLGYAGLSGDNVSFGDGGIYVSPSIGVSFRFNRKFGLNVLTGYTYQKVSYLYDWDYSNGNYHIYNYSGNIGNFHLKIGLEF